MADVEAWMDDVYEDDLPRPPPTPPQFPLTYIDHILATQGFYEEDLSTYLAGEFSDRETSEYALPDS